MSGHPDIQRLVGDLVRFGTIASVDHGARTCTVEIGDMVAGPLPWLALRAGKVRIWSPPSVGEQVALLCAEGDTNAGIVLPALYSDAFPSPSASPDMVTIAFDDGAVLSYDMAVSALAMSVLGSVSIDAPGGVTINGDIALTGTLTASEDVVASGKSLKNHKHGGVQAGGAQTGAPV